MKAFIVLILCLLIFGTAGFFGYQIFIKPEKQARQDAAQSAAANAPGKAPPDPSIPEFERCEKLKEGKKLLEARAAFESFIENNPTSTKLDAAKKELGDINVALFFSSAPSPDKEQYLVQKGDVLTRIEHKTKVPADLIMRVNNLDDPRKLRIGQVLTVPHADFSVKINRREKTIVLTNGEKFFKQYKVRIWKAPASKNPAPLHGKIGEKVAYRNGQRVSFGAKDYAGSARWILLTLPGFTIYSENTAEAGGMNPPANGLGVAPEDAEELSALLSRDVPVTVEG